MTPFYKSTGGNEVHYACNTARTVQCWVFSSQSGGGYCLKHANDYLTFFTGEDLLYREAIQFGAMGLTVCNIGTTVGTTTTGDAIFIPAINQAYDSTVANMYLPGLGDNTAVGMADYPMNNQPGILACADNTSNHNPIRMMFGADNQFFSFSRIADGSASAADDIMQADLVNGGTGLSPFTWYSATTTA
jgi:hypothetical protein